MRLTISKLGKMAGGIKRPLEMRRRTENGYALVALMGIMLFSLVLTTATAPKIQFETQREKEEEMLWRGQQVAAALSRYSQARGGQYPTDLNQLVDGFEMGLKKIRFLRPSATCDPMTPCTPGTTNWRIVHPGDPLVKELLDAYLATQQKGNVVLPPPPAALITFAQIGGAQLPGQSPDVRLDGVGGPVVQQGGSGLSPTDGSSFDSNGSSGAEGGPIIGVVSRKSDKMFRSYFGIEYYDHTLFFPTVPVIAGGFISPLTLGALAGSGPPQQCNGGGVLINGKCWGGLTPGILCRGPNGETIPCPK